MKSILLDEKLLGLVEMTSGLVNACFSLPEWQAVKMIFFAPWRDVRHMSDPNQEGRILPLPSRVFNFVFKSSIPLQAIMKWWPSSSLSRGGGMLG